MKLIPVFIYNGFSVGIKILTAIILNKVIAVYAGPIAYAYISQLQNIINTVLVLPSNIINTAIVRYTSILEERDAKLYFWRTALNIAAFFSIILGIMLFFGAPYINNYFFPSENFKYVFRILSGTIFLFALNNFFIAALNGLREIKKYILVNILNNIFNLVFSATLIYFFSIKGALISLVTSQAISIIITVYIFKTTSFFKIKDLFGFGNLKDTKNIFSFSLMAVVAGISLPLSLSIIRKMIVNDAGWVDAGYWDAIWKLSSIYLMFITTTISVYYLPKLSSTTNKIQLKKVLIKGILFVTTISFILAILIFVLKEFIVLTLFSNEFTPMLTLFKWQLIGDVLKMPAWLLGFFLISKAKVLIYIITEISQWVIFIVSSSVFVKNYGVIGTSYAHSLTQLLYLSLLTIVVIIILKKNQYE